MFRVLFGCMALALCTMACAGACDECPAWMIKATDSGVVKATIKSGNVTDGWVVTYKNSDGKEQELKVPCDARTCADCACADGHCDKDEAKTIKEQFFVKGRSVLVKLHGKKVEMMQFDPESLDKE